MKKLLLIFSFIFIVSHNAYSDHIEDGDIFYCNVEKHGSINLNSVHKIYTNQPKKFKFKVKILNEIGGELIFSENAESLFIGKTFNFLFHEFHIFEEYKAEDKAEIIGTTTYGNFSFEGNSFAHSGSFGKMETIEYFFATCDKF